LKKLAPDGLLGRTNEAVRRFNAIDLGIVADRETSIASHRVLTKMAVSIHGSLKIAILR
jgi:hypothetical protein